VYSFIFVFRIPGNINGNVNLIMCWMYKENKEKLEYVKFHNDVRFCKKLAK